MFNDIFKSVKKRDWVEEDDSIICCVTCVRGKGLCSDYDLCMHNGENKEYKDFIRFNENCSYSLWEYRGPK